MKLFNDIFFDTIDLTKNFGLALYNNPTPSVAGFGILMSLLAALWGLHTNRDIAKKRATLDLILGEQTNKEIFEKRQKFIVYRDGKQKLESYLDKQKLDKQKTGKNILPLPIREKQNRDTEKEIENAKEAISCITASINRYEMIAIGIEKKCICEEMYREWLQTTVVNDWKTVENFVIKLRKDKNIPNLYKRFEVMALRFNPNSSQPRRSWREKFSFKKKD